MVNKLIILFLLFIPYVFPISAYADIARPDGCQKNQDQLIVQCINNICKQGFEVHLVLDGYTEKTEPAFIPGKKDCKYNRSIVEDIPNLQNFMKMYFEDANISNVTGIYGIGLSYECLPSALSRGENNLSVEEMRSRYKVAKENCYDTYGNILSDSPSIETLNTFKVQSIDINSSRLYVEYSHPWRKAFMTFVLPILTLFIWPIIFILFKKRLNKKFRISMLIAALTHFILITSFILVS